MVCRKRRRIAYRRVGKRRSSLLIVTHWRLDRSSIAVRGIGRVFGYNYATLSFCRRRHILSLTLCYSSSFYRVTQCWRCAFCRRVSVCLSQADIVPKGLNAGSRKQRRMVAGDSFWCQRSRRNSDGVTPPQRGCQIEVKWVQIGELSTNISLYLRHGAR